MEIYVLLKKDNIFIVKSIHESKWNDSTPHDIKIFNKENGYFAGSFGIKDYAIIWRDFYNKLITREQLRFLLDNY